MAKQIINGTEYQCMSQESLEFGFLMFMLGVMCTLLFVVAVEKGRVDEKQKEKDKLYNKY